MTRVPRCHRDTASLVGIAAGLTPANVKAAARHSGKFCDHFPKRAMNLNNRLRPPKIPYRMSPVSFWGPGLRVSRIQQFSREKLMFLPCLARVLAYMLSIGFLLGTARAAVPPPDPGREVLPANDGWGALPTASLPLGTTGGSNASPARTVTVTSRKELVAALSFPDPAPKLIYVKGVIDVNVDDAGNAALLQGLRAPRPGHGREVFDLRVSGDVRPGRTVRPQQIRWADRKKRASPRPRRRQRACASAFHPTPPFLASARTPRSSAPGSTFAAMAAASR